MILEASIEGLEIRPAPFSSFSVQFNVYFGVFPAHLSFLPSGMPGLWILGNPYRRGTLLAELCS